MSRSLSLLLLTALAATGCGGRSSESPSTQSAQPAPAGPRVYVSDEPGGRVAIVDPVAGTVAGTLAVGKPARGIRLLSDGRGLPGAFAGSPIAGPRGHESAQPPPEPQAGGASLGRPAAV